MRESLADGDQWIRGWITFHQTLLRQFKIKWNVRSTFDVFNSLYPCYTCSISDTFTGMLTFLERIFMDGVLVTLSLFQKVVHSIPR